MSFMSHPTHNWSFRICISTDNTKTKHAKSNQI